MRAAFADRSMTPDEIRLGELLAAHFCDDLSPEQRVANDAEIERLRALDSDPLIREPRYWFDAEKRRKQAEAAVQS